MNAAFARIGFPLLGLLAIVGAASGVGLTFAIYNKAFTDTVAVTVLVEEVGEQLDVPADVKVRGVRVGEVRDSVPTEAGEVALQLALDPQHLQRIPADVTARILPKTLFGERYVELVSDQTDPAVTLTAGAVVRQDLSQRSVQLQEVFDELAPLLRTVQPAELNATLSSVATALSGRGEQLGGTIDALAGYTAEVRPLLPALQNDIALLADVVQRYGDAAPALLETARNVTTTARTLEEKEQVLEAVLRDTYAVSDRTGALLAENEERLVRLSATLRPTLELLAEYSPEYECVINGAKLGIRRIYDVFGGDDGPFQIKARFRLGQSRGGYTTEEAPGSPLARELVGQLADYGPACPKVTTAPIGGVPAPDIPEPAKVLIGTYRGPVGGPPPLPDGPSPGGSDPAQGPGLPGGAGPLTPPPTAGPDLPGVPRVPVLGDPTGSGGDRTVIEDAAAAVLGRTGSDVNPVTSLLLGPMLRGSDVEASR